MLAFLDQSRGLTAISFLPRSETASQTCLDMFCPILSALVRGSAGSGWHFWLSLGAPDLVSGACGSNFREKTRRAQTNRGECKGRETSTTEHSSTGLHYDEKGSRRSERQGQCSLTLNIRLLAVH